MVQNIYQHRYSHLLDLLERSGGQTATAERIGVTKQYIYAVTHPDPKKVKNIGNKMARRIEETFGLAVGSLDVPPGIDESQQDEHSVEVPLLNVVVAMGAGTTWTEEVIQGMRISKQWLRQNTQATSFSTLARITAKGDSMEPTFFDGSTLLIDTAVRKMGVDAVYVIARDHDLFVKRVQKRMDGSFDIISDNKAHEPERVEHPLKQGLVVCGRVLAALNVRKL